MRVWKTSQARIPAEAVAAGLASARLPGRFELLGARPQLLLDGAHNVVRAGPFQLAGTRGGRA
jgi:folylpolyglutamate synthase/dihydropteroate synthase